VEIGVRLTVVPNQGEADMICSLLRANGITCAERPANAAIPGMTGFGSWREILVPEDQLATARELLETA
jgi:hypothetical protein